MFLLDSNILIHLFRGAGRVAENMAQRPANDICIPTPALFELEYGTAKSSRPAQQRAQIDRVVRTFGIVPLDYPSARMAGVLRDSLESAGSPIGPYDLLIAGIALAHKLTVVTRNVREFSRVPGLAVENWYD
jgi:tRNA(fMet)-specific endonuclease VapC